MKKIAADLLKLLDDVYDGNLTDEEAIKLLKTIAVQTARTKIDIDNAEVLLRPGTN